jgi:sarcosine oxidase subunit alpha
MWGPARIGQGLLTDSHKPIEFRFDGHRMRGLSGDTLASALLANGQRLVGRSLKYHRPRGIVTCGPEEPCALVEVCSAEKREPNRLATTLELYEGLEAERQNRWPSLRFDALAANDLLARFLPAGFYYKTFMAPAPAWERIYEPLLRRAAGLGRLAASKDAPHAPAETVHDHVDVLVVGAGAAGLAAAQRLPRPSTITSMCWWWARALPASPPRSAWACVDCVSCWPRRTRSSAEACCSMSAGLHGGKRQATRSRQWLTCVALRARR